MTFDNWYAKRVDIINQRGYISIVDLVAVYRAGMRDAADMCDGLANGFVSDVNPDMNSDCSKGAQACAELIRKEMGP